MTPEVVHAESMLHACGNKITVRVDHQENGDVSPWILKISIDSRLNGTLTEIPYGITRWGWQMGGDSYGDSLEASRQVMRYGAFYEVSDDETLGWISGALVRATRFVIRKTFKDRLGIAIRLFQLDEIEDMVRIIYVSEVHES